jgi:anti-sigma regulatory factor (Ser/Thr protein kinase)
MGAVAVDQPGCEHVALVHRGVDDLVRRLAPSLHRAAAESAAVLLSLDPVAEQRVKADLGSICDSFTFRRAADRIATPGIAMADLHRFVVDSTSAGSPTAWSIGATPLTRDGRDSRWIRYEEAVLHLFADRPLRAVCLYDAETTPVGLRDGVHRTHQSLDGEWADGVGGDDDLAAASAADATPSDEPDLVLIDPTPRMVRAALAGVVADLPADRLSDIQLAASELVTNAVVHGTPPVEFRAWWRSSGCVLQVRDCGTSVIDPYADLRACVGGPHGGFGLWTVGQISDAVDITHDDSGNTVTAFVAAG